MPTFEYTGPTPNEAPRFKCVDLKDGGSMMVGDTPAAVSEPIDYDWHGGHVVGRIFEASEHVTADTNPDPARFTEVTDG